MVCTYSSILNYFQYNQHFVYDKINYLRKYVTEYLKQPSNVQQLNITNE